MTAVAATPQKTSPEVRSLLQEFDELVGAIERSAIKQTWALADWLVENTESQGQGGDRKRGATRLTIRELASKRRAGFSMRWLQEMRSTAEHFPPDTRVPGSSVRAHLLAYREADKNVEAAREALRVGRDQPKRPTPVKPSPVTAGTAPAAASDFQTLQQVLWVDFKEAQRLAATLPKPDEDQGRLLHKRATELRAAADWMDALAIGVVAP